MRRAQQLLPVIAIAVLLVAAPFVFGYVVGHRDGAGPELAPIESWLARARLVGASAEPVSVPAPSEEEEELFRPFWEAWSYVNREYHDESALDSQRLSRGAIRGMVGALQDPYSLYLDPFHRELTEAELRGVFEGIGVQVEMAQEQLRIVSPLEGSPGARAGLRPGDVITHVDGREVKGMSLPEAIRLIRGPRGSTVALTIRREGRSPFDVALTREEIRVSPVRGEVRSDGIAYVRISTFSMRVGSELRQLLDRLSERRPRGWVLDLRGNPGGYLEGAVAVTSQFVQDSVVLYEERRGGERVETRTRGTARATSGPMAVVVDKGTASAAEIVAAALRDHGRATLIGDQTFGKGSVQALHRLSDGSALRLTVARWLTPKGEPIEGVGLAPAIAGVAGAGVDAPLEQAIDHVRQQPTASLEFRVQSSEFRAAAALTQTSELGIRNFVGIADGEERTAGWV